MIKTLVGTYLQPVKNWNSIDRNINVRNSMRISDFLNVPSDLLIVPSTYIFARYHQWIQRMDSILIIHAYMYVYRVFNLNWYKCFNSLVKKYFERLYLSVFIYILELHINYLIPIVEPICFFANIKIFSTNLLIFTHLFPRIF